MSTTPLPRRIPILDVNAARADRLRYEELCQLTAAQAAEPLCQQLARLAPNNTFLDEDLVHSLAMEFSQGLWSSLLCVWRRSAPQAGGCVALGLGRCRVPAQTLQDVSHFGVPASELHALFEHVLATLRSHAEGSPFVALPSGLKLALRDDAR